MKKLFVETCGWSLFLNVRFFSTLAGRGYSGPQPGYLGARQWITAGFSVMTLMCGLLSPNSALAQDTDLHRFLAGEKTKYSTKGHPKAKGLNVTIEYPASWVAAEGERPNVIQKFSPPPENGITTDCMIMIRNLPFWSAFFPRQLLEAGLFKELQESVPPGGVYLDGKVTHYDGQPGAWVSYSVDFDRAGIALRMYMLSHQLVYLDKLIFVQCAVGGALQQEHEDFQIAFMQRLPLFQQIGNSIIVHDKWTSTGNEVPPGAESAQGSSWWLEMFISLILTWGIGLAPPLLIRFVIIRRPLQKFWALGTVSLFWLLNLMFFIALGSQSKTHGALFLVAWVSYGILRKGKNSNNNIGV